MRNKCLIPAATFLCAIHAGCARFHHQTTEREPHALVTVGRTSESSAQGGALKSLDRLPVNAGSTYRVRPGKHVVIVEVTERSVETGRHQTLFGSPPEDEPAEVFISGAGSVSASGVQPFGTMQPVNLSIEQRRRRDVSRAIIVQAGKHYRLVGDPFMPCQLLMP
jgi:hypothetical protein